MKSCKGLIYLASPYTHQSNKIMHNRFEKVLRLSAYLIKKGFFIFSPVVYSHIMNGRYEMPSNWKYWLNFDKTVICKCDKLLVFTINGWRQSRGVREEIKIAKEYKIPIEYIGDKIKKRIKANKCVCLCHEK